MPTLPPADQLSTPGPAGVQDAEVDAAAVAAAKAAIVLRITLLVIWHHARFLLCNSAKLTRPDLAVVVDRVPSNTAP